MGIELRLLTRLSLFLALAIAAQQLRLQWLTGPLINTILILATMTVGTAGGVLLGVLTPVLAFFQGILPLAVMIPFIMLGNACLCLAYAISQKFVPTLVLAPLLKSAVIALGAASIAGLPFQAALVMGLTQWGTAAAGVVLAMLISPYISNIDKGAKK